ncbi:MAG: cell division protein FtsL [Lachnospiraceae bacterium]|nr:cell division protein FtsL [Lachnospiraceae bacterium]
MNARDRRYRSEYVHGNTVRKHEERSRRDDRRLRSIKGGRQAGRQRGRKNILQLLSMAAALTITALALYNYVSVQTKLEASTTRASRLEKELAVLRQENDEAYSRANSHIDLEEVKRVAIQELGMKYAEEGQIITYSDEGAADYVRQLAQIPDAGK